MSDVNWTPGPWVNGCNQNGDPIVLAKEPSYWSPSPNKEALANRRLCDAAPELFHALNELVILHVAEQEGISCGMPTSEQWEAAVDAAAEVLAKARGES